MGLFAYMWREQLYRRLQSNLFEHLFDQFRYIHFKYSLDLKFVPDVVQGIEFSPEKNGSKNFALSIFNFH